MFRRTTSWVSLLLLYLLYAAFASKNVSTTMYESTGLLQVLHGRGRADYFAVSLSHEL